MSRCVVIACLAAGLFAAPMTIPQASAQIFMSPEEAKKLGTQEHPKILKEFGGVYDDPNIGAYVAGIAGRIAGQSGQPASSFTFTVLNSPIVNAFALPGGYVYITRGTLALANNEAEAAGVLGHEIGHVIAQHSEKRYDRSLITQGAVGIGSVLGSIFLGSGAGDLVGQLGSVGGGLYLAGFSRENELEADTIGVKLLARVGYAPEAQAAFLQSMSNYGDLAGKMAGRNGGGGGVSDLFATHPGGPQRVKEAMAAAKEYPNSPVYRRDEYLDRIDGMIYGDDPKEGVVRGNTFTHPGLRVGFSMPDGWPITNASDAVVASNSAGRIQFDIEGDKKKVQASRNAQDYLTRIWVPKLPLKNVETIKVNGMPAATATARIQLKSGNADVRFVAVGFPTDDIMRFVVIAPPGGLGKIDQLALRSINTLKHLSAAEAAAVKPVRLKVVKVGSGDTVESYAKVAPLGSYATEQLRLLNALKDSEQPKPGERFKTVE
ncbi:M48 family metalloprotease [Ferrovibrio terrae]|uniref:M48 family metalloprotease n=2 Tax=Ferrovibrio terrae TaxID=2594003 RepID=UPI00313817AA